jgi:hypothetical protein
MARNRDLNEVKRRARNIFTLEAPAFLRWGEPIYRAVDHVTSYAYREGKQAGHEERQDQQHHRRGPVRATWEDNKTLVGHLLTLATSATAASVAAPAIGPVISPLVAWGIGLLLVGILFGRAFIGGRDG